MTDSLAKLDRATQMLAEVRGIDDAKDLIDLAEAARVYARQVGLGLEAQNHAAEIKLRAQRKAGEILDKMEKAKGAQGKIQEHLTGGYSQQPPDEHVPTYAELDIDKRDAHTWQTIAAIPEDEFEKTIVETASRQKELTTAGMYRKGKENKQSAASQEIEAAGEQSEKQTDNYKLFTCDIRQLSANVGYRSADIIITDPPYPQEYLWVYGELSLQASQVLKPGGLAIVMVGQSYLPDVIRGLSTHLTYHWTAAYLTPGGQSSQLWNRKVNNFWKPLLIFVNGEYSGGWFGDVCKSAVNDNDKRYHGWGQSESGMLDIIERFTKPGQVILDPFCGGGSTGMGAIQLNRYFVGCDVDEKSINITAGRIKEWQSTRK